MKFFSLGPLLLLAVTSAVQAGQINIVSRGDDNAAYAIGMINLALKELGDSGYQMRVQEEAWTAPRLRQGLIDGKIDIIWTATSKALEQDTIPSGFRYTKGSSEIESSSSRKKTPRCSAASVRLRTSNTFGSARDVVGN